MLVYGIPEFRLPKAIVQKEVDGLKALGVKVETNMVIGRVVSIDELIYGENAEVLSTKHLAAEQKRAVADLLQGLTLYNDGNDKDGLARTRLLLQVIKTMGL